MRHAKSEEAAKKAAEFLKKRLPPLMPNPTVGLVLGTGWGDTLQLERVRRIPFQEIPGFGALDPLEGHAREVICGTLGEVPVVALRGRIHLNERPADAELHAMVRLQIEMLIQLGVKTLILTCAAGSLQPEIKVGNIVLINGFVTIFAPEMPMFAGEFFSPEDTIDRELMTRIYQLHGPLALRRGGHVMLRGPFFEGRRYDKSILRLLVPDGRVGVVGMSVLPEACVASLYPDVRTVPIAFVTNTDSEEHSHEENQLRAKAQSEHLGNLLAQIISLTPR